MSVWLCPRKVALNPVSINVWNQIPSFECPEHFLGFLKTQETLVLASNLEAEETWKS